MVRSRRFVLDVADAIAEEPLVPNGAATLMIVDRLRMLSHRSWEQWQGGRSCSKLNLGRRRVDYIVVDFYKTDPLRNIELMASICQGILLI